MGPHITQYYSILYSLTTFLYIVYSNLKFTCYVTIAYYAKLHQVFEGETEYARGWIVSPETWGGGLVLQHAGSNSLWLCQVWVAPKKNFACLVACNELNEGARTALEEARQKLVERYIDTCLDVHSDLKSL